MDPGRGLGLGLGYVDPGAEVDSTCSCMLLILAALTPPPHPPAACAACVAASRCMDGGAPAQGACNGRVDASRGRSSSPPRKVPRLVTAAAAAAAAGPPPLPQQLQPSSLVIPAPPSSCPDLVELNVGGALFTTSRATLEESQPHSMLAALVSGRHGPARRDAKVR